jgi:DNA replication protein DnaC
MPVDSFNQGREQPAIQAVQAIFERIDAREAAITEEQRDARQRFEAARAAKADLEQRRAVWLSLLRAIGKRYETAAFASYATPHKGQADAVAKLTAYADNAAAELDAGNGIVLFGPSGTGKDHLLLATARAVLRRRHVTMAWINGVALFAAFRDGLDCEGRESSGLARYKTPQVLILSDPLPPVGELSPFQASKLLEVIDHRYREQKATWVSINVAHRDEADKRLTPAIADRLRHGALTIHCHWPSHRRASP